MMSLEEQIFERFNLEKTIKEKEFFLNNMKDVLNNLNKELEELKGDKLIK